MTYDAIFLADVFRGIFSRLYRILNTVSKYCTSVYFLFVCVYVDTGTYAGSHFHTSFVPITTYQQHFKSHIFETLKVLFQFPIMNGRSNFN